MPKKGNKDSIVESFKLVKILQDRLNNSDIQRAVGLSNATVKRMKSVNSFQEYRDLVTRYNAEHSPKPTPPVLKPVETTVTPVTASKTNDISQLGEITTMSLLNAILAELKQLNATLEGKKFRLF